jgi:hypothetical protein
MIRVVLIIVMLTTCLLANSQAQKPVTPVSPVPDCHGNIRQNPQLTARVADFLDKLQSAVAANDRERVALLIHYPLHVVTKDRTLVVRSKTAFIEQYNQIFSPDIRNVLMSQQAECVNISAQGPLMFGEGTIWFNSFAGRKLSAGGEFEIITINPLRPTIPRIGK